MPQSVQPPILDLWSGDDLTVHEIEPHIRFCVNSAKTVWGSLSPSLSTAPPFMCVHAHSLSK